MCICFASLLGASAWRYHYRHYNQGFVCNHNVNELSLMMVRRQMKVDEWRRRGLAPLLVFLCSLKTQMSSDSPRHYCRLVAYEFCERVYDTV